MENPGVGKTHLATALETDASKKKNQYILSYNDLITNLSNVFKENRLEVRLNFIVSINC